MGLNIKAVQGLGGHSDTGYVTESDKQKINIVVEHETLGTITVKSRYSRESLIKKLNYYKSKEMFDKGYVRLYVDPMDKVTYEDVVREVNDKITVLNNVLDKKSLYHYLEEIAVKKNGKFRKKSVVKLFDLENCCRFSKSRGYQWLVPRVQLQAIDENTVELIFEERWDGYEI